MKLLSWYCRGLGNPLAVWALRRLIRKKDPDVVFAMETRRSSSELVALQGIGGFNNLFPVSCAGAGRSRAGGLCLLWQDDIDNTMVHSSLNHILFHFVHRDTNVLMQVLAVYVWPEEHNKWRTWHMIKRYKPYALVSWLCIGYFYAILSPTDKLGGNPVDFAHLQVAMDALLDCGLRDVGYSGYRYTWSNKRKAPNTIEERLDYALVNDS